MRKVHFALSFHLLRPAFYSVSPMLSRAFDLLSVFVQIYAIGSPRKWYPLLYIFLLFLALFSISQVISLFLSAMSSNVILKDMIPLAYPYIAAVGLLLGVSTRNEKEAFKVLERLLFFGVVLAIFQEHSGEIGIWLSQVYNTPALTVVGRFGGFSYTHTEHAAFCALYVVILMKGDKGAAIKACLLLLALYSMAIPLSKAGFILMCIVLIPIFRWYQHALIGLFVFILTSFFWETLYLQFGYLIIGFGALIDMNLMDGSIGPRFEDWVLAISALQSSTAAFFFGLGPMRFYEVSYIEITSANILYRFGVVGWILYYAPLIKGYFLARELKASYLGYFLFGVFFVDHAANFSESVKLFPVLYFLYGILIVKKYRMVQ